MPERIYLTVAEVLEMHWQLIEEFGGIQGLRDRGLLESAVFRPQSGYYEDLVHEAAALMESLANNRAFLDGNKRISLAATNTFLRINGLYLELEPVAAHSFITDAISKREFRPAKSKIGWRDTPGPFVEGEICRFGASTKNKFTL